MRALCRCSLALRSRYTTPVTRPVRAVFDPRGAALVAQVQISGRLGARNLRVQRAPLGPGLASLDAEALLDAQPAAIRRPGVDGHVVGVHALVADALRAVVHHLEMVRGRQARIAVAPRDDHAFLGELVVVLQFGVFDGPVDQRRALDVAVGGASPHLPGPDARRRAGPMHRGAAHRLAGPRRQRRIVLRHRRGAGHRARLQPGQLAKGLARDLREGGQRLPRARFDQDHLDAAARQFVRQRTAAGPRTDDDHRTGIIL